MRNLGTFDRLLRVILAEVGMLAAFFWLSKEWQIVLYLLAVVLLVQAATGVCGFYSFLRWNTCETVKRKNKSLISIAIVAMIVVAAVGSYGSAVLTGDIFQNDLNSIKEPYDLTMQYTSQDLRQESVQQFELLESANTAFDEKYRDYRPWAVKFDDKFTGDLQNLSAIITGAGEDIHQGSLKTAHDKLQSAEPVFQSIRERNHLL